jgi:ribosome-associated protein
LEQDKFASSTRVKPKASKVIRKSSKARKLMPADSLPVRREPSEQSRRIALVAAEAGLAKKASEIEIVDVSSKVDYADYLVLMTGHSDRHVAAIADHVDDLLGQHGFSAMSVEGLPRASWVLLDFVDVVVHVFLAEARTLYDLDGLWLDARRLPVPGHPVPERPGMGPVPT